MSYSLSVWKGQHQRNFFAAYKRFTNGGICWHIIPYIDFETLETGKEPQRLSYYSGRKWTEDTGIPLGVNAGIENGLELLLDIESFETVGFFSNGANGFKMALLDPHEAAFTLDQAAYISPG